MKNETRKRRMRVMRKRRSDEVMSCRGESEDGVERNKLRLMGELGTSRRLGWFLIAL